MAQVVRRCKAVGKPVGTIGGTPEMVAQYRAIGFDYVAIASDLGLLVQAALAALASLRTPGSMHVHTLAGGTQTGSGL
jgi:2-dehydro-3-deoxyglucarate aldolase